jgi:hypothetical protein
MARAGETTDADAVMRANRNLHDLFTHVNPSMLGATY